MKTYLTQTELKTEQTTQDFGQENIQCNDKEDYFDIEEEEQEYGFNHDKEEHDEEDSNNNYQLTEEEIQALNYENIPMAVNCAICEGTHYYWPTGNDLEEALAECKERYNRHEEKLDNYLTEEETHDYYYENLPDTSYCIYCEDSHEWFTVEVDGVEQHFGGWECDKHKKYYEDKFHDEDELCFEISKEEEIILQDDILELNNRLFKQRVAGAFFILFALLMSL